MMRPLIATRDIMKVEVECYLGDSKKGELLCGRVFTLRGKQLE